MNFDYTIQKLKNDTHPGHQAELEAAVTLLENHSTDDAPIVSHADHPHVLWTNATDRKSLKEAREELSIVPIFGPVLGLCEISCWSGTINRLQFYKTLSDVMETPDPDTLVVVSMDAECSRLTRTEQTKNTLRVWTYYELASDYAEYLDELIGAIQRKDRTAMEKWLSTHAASPAPTLATFFEF